jgi:HPt (histidine-containing phosphotransfer) domain-containing protein
VPDEEQRAAPSARRLPPEARAGLRRAFARELAERLPRLRQAVDSDDDALLQTAVRDAHSLASSAAVVGLADASLSARRAEELLVGRRPGQELGEAQDAVRRCVQELHDHLAGWRP